jgi:hypothetical protein
VISADVGDGDGDCELPRLDVPSTDPTRVEVTNVDGIEDSRLLLDAGSAVSRGRGSAITTVPSTPETVGVAKV